MEPRVEINAFAVAKDVCHHLPGLFSSGYGVFYTREGEIEQIANRTFPNLDLRRTGWRIKITYTILCISIYRHKKHKYAE